MLSSQKMLQTDINYLSLLSSEQRDTEVIPARLCFHREAKVCVLPWTVHFSSDICC